MVYRTQSFTHYGHGFTIEAEGWLDEELADAVIVDLQMWTLHLDRVATASLHSALTEQREALVHGADYDPGQQALKAVRQAQRLAVRNGLGTQGATSAAERPTVTLEVFQASES